MHNSLDWNRSGRMASRNSLGVAVALLMIVAGTARAQDPMPNPQEMQMQVQHIMQERPREAEAAARAWLQNVAPDLIPSLDSLKLTSGDQYWAEVGQLTVQFDVVHRLLRRVSRRAQLVGKVFRGEANARAEQWPYGNAGERARPAVRAKIEALITQHFDLE